MVIIETFTLFDALAQYLEHARLEARWISQIADAFEGAGTGELTNEVLDLLAPALNSPTMSDRQLLRSLATFDEHELTTFFKSSPALANQLQLIDPVTIHRWWGELPATDSRSQSDVLWKSLPEIFGNLEGIPYSIRHEANTLVLKRKLEALKTKLAAITTEQHDAMQNARSRAEFRQAASTSLSHEEWAQLTTQLQAYKEIQASLEVDYGQANRQLISLSADEPPLAAISIGNLDTASNITYTVAGMTSSTTSMTDWTDATAGVHQVVSEGSDEAATVAWLGYEAPPAPPASWGVFGNEMAQNGGDNLVSALRGIDAVRGNDAPQINVVAHSYGTTATAFALSKSDVRVDNAIFVGSAGIPDHIEHVSDLNAAHVFAGHAQDVYPLIEAGKGDQWAWIGRDFSLEHTVDPMREEFGATTFGTDTEVEDVGDPVTTHSVHEAKAGAGYFDPDTESLDNIGYILRNETDKLSDHIDQGLTMFQQSLIPGGPAHYYR